MTKSELIDRQNVRISKLRGAISEAIYHLWAASAVPDEAWDIMIKTRDRLKLVLDTDAGKED